ncbi:MAG: polyprenyl synthetase family protein, partial [Myxococcota bacterium]
SVRASPRVPLHSPAPSFPGLKMNRSPERAAATAVSGSALLDHPECLRRTRQRMAELAGDAQNDPGARMLHDHLDAGGKHLRARLALAACDALGGRAADAIDWAAAVELLHNGSLVHDDIQDEDSMRRGKPALWARHGAAQAINAGDLLLMLPFRALARYPSELQVALIQRLALGAETTARGQIRELAFCEAAVEGWDEYVAAASGKTGTLFALPVEGAAIIAGAPDSQAEKIGATFASIGVLYQLQDDLLDLVDAKGRGTAASDLLEGRLSALVLSHFELHPDERAPMLAFLRTPRSNKARFDVKRWKDRLARGGAVQHLLARIDALAAGLLHEALAAGSPIHDVAERLIGIIVDPLQPIRSTTRATTHA